MRAAGATGTAGTLRARRVAITGMGAVTPLGNTMRDTWAAVRRGDCGITPITAYDTSGQAAKLAAQVRIDAGGAGAGGAGGAGAGAAGVGGAGAGGATGAAATTTVTPAEARKMDRFTLLAVLAAREAFADSGITAHNTDFERADVLIGSGIGGLATTVREHSRALERGFDRTSPFFIPMTIANMAAGRVAIDLGLKGDSSCTVTACASSAHALGEALRHVRHGYADVVLAGGAEASVIPLAMGGFTSMQALHTGSVVDRASIPFDAERSGFVLGEGAGMLVLEEWEHARRRGATIYAELTGFGAACDAYHITAPHPEGTGAVRAMSRALADAGLDPADIGYINAHGTSTQLNDKSEIRAVKELFGASTAVPISSTKSMTGHLLGAAGAVEALICACAVREGFIPATINYRVPDPVCDLDVVPNKGREAKPAHALSNSLGFGGHNAALIVSRHEDTDQGIR